MVCTLVWPFSISTKGVVQADDVQILPYAHLELLFEGGG